MPKHGDQGRDERPTRSDLRESRAIEQNADIVALLHLPSYYDRKSRYEVIIAKHRNGQTGNIGLWLEERYYRFKGESDR